MPSAPSIPAPLAELPTPALLLDLDAFEFNLAAAMRVAQMHGLRVRPHAKAHKCVEIARRQIAAGAVGICVQKVSEAEPFAAAGIGDILITNEVVGHGKPQRLAQLAAAHPRVRFGVCVDALANVADLAQACSAAGAVLDVYVELDVGQGRCGVPDAATAARLAQAIAAQPALRLRGLQAYHGGAQHLRRANSRREAVWRAGQLAAAARDAIRALGLPCEIVTGGGTGTFPAEADTGVYHEVQPGSFVLMDADYKRNDVDPETPDFRQALSVLTTVISVGRDRAVLDAGLKAFATDSGVPVPVARGWSVVSVSDEHTVLRREPDDRPDELPLGAVTRLIPGHCDPTVNLHDALAVVRGEQVLGHWRIDARGALI